jgi:hypothetical protein
MSPRTKVIVILIYALATVQFAWCYFWITRPYINTLAYEQGLERMPFQGRLLMMLPMRWAHHSAALHRLTQTFGISHFWFPRPVAPEVLMQAAINVACLLLAGFFTTRIYQASSSRRLPTPLIYPLFLVVCGITYVFHTVQNFRFPYDFPSLAFFAAAMYLLCLRKHWSYFAALLLIATINRETTLLLPLYLLNQAVEEGRLQPRLLLRPLSLCWTAWQLLLHHLFAHNPSEFYPRINWNVKSLLVPQAWPQLLSACGYLMLFVALMRRRILDPQLRAWFWLLPVWSGFMFVSGILIETRVFGELIPFVVCTTTLILELLLLVRLAAPEIAPLMREAITVVETDPTPVLVTAA